MARTRGGGQVGARRSRRNQGLEATPPTTLRVIKGRVGGKKKTGKKKKLPVEDEEIEDVTPQPINLSSTHEAQVDQRADDVFREDGMDEDVEVNANGDDNAEKIMSEDEVAEEENAEKIMSEDEAAEEENAEKVVSKEQESHQEANKIGDSQKEIPEKAVSKEQESHQDGLEREGHEKGAEDTMNPTLEHNGNEDEAVHMEEDGVSNGKSDDAVKEKKRRGPTKMRKVAENPQEKVEVEFNDCGDHVGPGSVTLSSFLGPLVREHVPVTLSDWRKLDPVTRDTMWEEIQGRFKVQEEWQKAVIFKQLGNLWRAGKSRLVSEVRAAKTAADRKALKPSNIPSIQT